MNSGKAWVSSQVPIRGLFAETHAKVATVGLPSAFATAASSTMWISVSSARSSPARRRNRSRGLSKEHRNTGRLVEPNGSVARSKRHIRVSRATLGNTTGSLSATLHRNPEDSLAVALTRTGRHRIELLGVVVKSDRPTSRCRGRPDGCP